jgi:hypothetical protein
MPANEIWADALSARDFLQHLIFRFGLGCAERTVWGLSIWNDDGRTARFARTASVSLFAGRASVPGVAGVAGVALFSSRSRGSGVAGVTLISDGSRGARISLIALIALDARRSWRSSYGYGSRHITGTQSEG